jgi:uncharacterized alpha-E superfamily protein
VQNTTWHIQRRLVERAEHQLRLIQAVYRTESDLQHGEALEELRGRCEALLDMTAPMVGGDPRLREMLDEIRQQLRADVPSTHSPVA